MKVIIFSENNKYDLECKLNEWLKENYHLFIDIKYSSSKTPAGYEFYTAMIIHT